MTKRLVDIDDATLERARRVLGATTMKDTVGQALSEVVALAERREHVRRLARQEDLDLGDDRVMRDAWR